MNTSSMLLPNEEYIRAAADHQLSSSASNLLRTLLNEEDQLQYNQLLNTSISIDIHHLLHQVSSLLHLSSSAVWMATILLKRLLIQQHSLDLIIIVACVTLSSKYQHSASQTIDYELLAQSCHIDHIQQIHDAELHLLDHFSYDISVTTPDHFFSYLSNLDNNNNSKQLIDQTRSSLSISSFSHQTHALLHNYPCSIVVLSLMCMSTSSTFVTEQIKDVLRQKKDPSHYLNELVECVGQLQNVSVQQ